MTELDLPPAALEPMVPSVEARAPRSTLRRSRSDRMIAGVAGGVAQHLGLDPIVVRAAFVVLSLALGFGVVVYALLWVLAPAEVVGSAAPAAPRQLPRPST